MGTHTMSFGRSPVRAGSDALAPCTGGYDNACSCAIGLRPLRVNGSNWSAITGFSGVRYLAGNRRYLCGRFREAEHTRDLG